MNTNQWTPVLVALVLAIGSVQAFADSGWHYDEGTDTIVLNFGNDTVVPSASNQEDEAVEIQYGPRALSPPHQAPDHQSPRHEPDYQLHLL